MQLQSISILATLCLLSCESNPTSHITIKRAQSLGKLYIAGSVCSFSNKERPHDIAGPGIGSIQFDHLLKELADDLTFIRDINNVIELAAVKYTEVSEVYEELQDIFERVPRNLSLSQRHRIKFVLKDLINECDIFFRRISRKSKHKDLHLYGLAKDMLVFLKIEKVKLWNLEYQDYYPKLKN